MATQQSAKISITNDTGGAATVLLFHSNSSNGTQSGSWDIASGETAGPLTVLFETGLGAEGVLDYWSAIVRVKDGPTPGLYVNTGRRIQPVDATH